MNYKDKYLGEVSVKDAFSKSINTVAVKISENIGREKVIKMAKLMGINSPILNSPSLALGTSEVNLLELTAAYDVLANSGNGIFVHGIRSIENTEGKNLFTRKIQGHKTRCQQCGLFGHTRERCRRTLKAICHKCGKQGHLQAVCHMSKNVQ